MKYLDKAKDPEFWRAVREKDVYRPLREKYLARWEEECENLPPVNLKYSDWKEFWISGKRIERNYFMARQQLMAAVFLALIYPEETKYFDRVEDQLYSICNEYTWCIPAHYGKPMEGNRYKIDLFASETGFALAEIYTIFEDRLDEFIKSRIKEEVFARIVNSMITTPQFGFETMSNNWSAVCACSVSGAAMLLFPERFAEIKPRIDAAMALYLTGYHDDGVCLEGASYWGYGFGFYTYYADMLKDFTDGGEDLFAIPKVKNIATFMQKTFLTGNTCVSFSDGGRTAAFNVGLLHYLKTVFPEDVVLLKSEFKTGRDGCARFAPALREFIWFKEDMYENPEDGVAEFEFFADGAEWFIKRCPAYGFAAKGGHNREPHNHLDVGSFIFAKNGEQVLFDLGPGAYTKQYFSGERYNTFQAHSRSHSVPFFGENYQKPGKGYAAKDTRLENGEFSTDISAAYGIEELKAFVRSFSFTDTSVIMTDTLDYEGEDAVTERFVTLTRPEVSEGVITIGSGKLYFDASISTPAIGEEELNNGAICYLIDFTLPKGAKSFTVTVE